jgi:hypothetical protein
MLKAHNHSENNGDFLIYETMEQEQKLPGKMSGRLRRYSKDSSVHNLLTFGIEVELTSFRGDARNVGLAHFTVVVAFPIAEDNIFETHGWSRWCRKKRINLYGWFGRTGVVLRQLSKQ